MVFFLAALPFVVKVVVGVAAVAGTAAVGYQVRKTYTTVKRVQTEAEKRVEEVNKLSARTLKITDALSDTWNELNNAWEEWKPEASKLKETITEQVSVMHSISGGISWLHFVVVYTTLLALGYIQWFCFDIESMNQVLDNTSILTLAVLYVKQKQYWVYNLALLVATLGVPVILAVGDATKCGFGWFAAELKRTILVLLFVVTFVFACCRTGILNYVLQCCLKRECPKEV